MKLMKIKCNNCGKEVNHIKLSGVNPWCDIFTECIYENGKLRWAGAKIGRYQGNHSTVVCSNCGEKYLYKGVGSFFGNYKFIEYLKKINGLILSEKNKGFLRECNVSFID